MSSLKATLAGKSDSPFLFHNRQAIALIFLTAGLSTAFVTSADASIPVTELLEQGERYQQQGLSVTGYAGSITILTGPRDRPFYTFTLRDSVEDPETVTVIMQGKPEFVNRDRVYVYGVFFKSRKAGRTTITNRIEATIVERVNDELMIG